MASKMKMTVERWTHRAPVAEIQKNLTQGLVTLKPLIEATVRAECPVLTGRTRDSISSEVHEDTGSYGLGVGADHFPARFIEWGTVNSKPNPFVKRSFRKLRPTIEEVLKSAARKSV